MKNKVVIKGYIAKIQYDQEEEKIHFLLAHKGMFIHCVSPYIVENSVGEFVKVQGRIVGRMAGGVLLNEIEVKNKGIRRA